MKTSPWIFVPQAEFGGANRAASPPQGPPVSRAPKRPRRVRPRTPWQAWVGIAVFLGCLAVATAVFYDGLGNSHKRAVRAWLKENLDDPTWEEVKWYDPLPLRGILDEKVAAEKAAVMQARESVENARQEINDLPSLAEYERKRREEESLRPWEKISQSANGLGWGVSWGVKDGRIYRDRPDFDPARRRAADLQRMRKSLTSRIKDQADAERALAVAIRKQDELGTSGAILVLLKLRTRVAGNPTLLQELFYVHNGRAKKAEPEQILWYAKKRPEDYE